MTTKRLGFLVVFIGLGMSAVLLMPKSSAQPTGIILRLPAELLDWTGRDEEVTTKEKETLGLGTEFARKRYRNTNPRTPIEALVSIVLSGRDMSNSIHRPERCLEAQGWAVLGSSQMTIDVPRRGSFPLTRLRIKRDTVNEQTHEHRTEDGISFYWFVGEREISGGHWSCRAIDYKDRFLRGVDQRWAFITVLGIIPRAKDPSMQPEVEKVVDQSVRDLVRDIATEVHKDGLQYD